MENLKDRLDTIVADLSDAPMRAYSDPDAGLYDGVCVVCANKGRHIIQKPDIDLTVKLAAMRALVANLEEDAQEKSGEKKLERAKLYYKLKKFDGGSKLSAHETTMILERVAKFYHSPLVLYQVKDAIEGVE